MRKVFIRETLSNSSLESCYHLQRTEVCKTIREVHSKIGEPIQIGEITFLTVFNVVLSMLWGGSKFDDVKNQKGNSSLGVVFRAAITKMVELMGKPNISDFFPVLARFDLQGVEREMNEILVAVEQLSENEDGAIPITMTQIKALLMYILYAKGIACWKHSPNGIFSTKSAHHSCQQQVPSRAAYTGDWQQIWRTKGPNRWKHFTWLARRDRLLTNAMKHQRHLSVDSSCPICLHHAETSLHALRDCPRAKQVWSELIPPSQWLHFFSLPFPGWIDVNLGNPP
ncbi:putative ribonuclease H protein [Camellia lanceoleosa]|uniref:Ribonuclease H protein n=1 Tax=Camellia lanceoleosa TaxID=1840588 RepID=A0ACC0G475_9ERIC|nr:putative ribonuclease H protein [Camellia lanceoleosa]